MVDTVCRPLNVTVISARDLENVRDPMHTYVIASLSGDERHNTSQRTPVDEDGGTSPRWDHTLADPFTVDVAAARAGYLTLKLKIKTRRTVTINRHRHVGWVDVPVRELLEQGDGGQRRATRYAVRLPSGGTRGFLEFSYMFGEEFTVHGAAPYQPPAN